MTFTGISEIKAAEREMEAARAYLDSIIATIRQPLVVLDEALHVISASSSFHRVFSVKTEKLIGRHLLAAGDLGRPVIAPPGVPAERIKMLRQAFMKALNDPQLLAQAEKQNVEIEPTSGEELEALAKEVMAQPPEVVERMKKLIRKYQTSQLHSMKRILMLYTLVH
jgi:transcriptional regulator with PAS, ATPase and Fis domain